MEKVELLISIDSEWIDTLYDSILTYVKWDRTNSPHWARLSLKIREAVYILDMFYLN